MSKYKKKIKRIRAKEFNRKFDAGEDIAPYLDFKRAVFVDPRRMRMLDLLDSRWQLYFEDSDELMPDPNKAVIYNCHLMRDGFSLEIKQKKFSFLKHITDRADIKAVKSCWGKIEGKSLKEAAAVLAEWSRKVRKHK